MHCFLAGCARLQTTDNCTESRIFNLLNVANNGRRREEEEEEKEESNDCFDYV